MVSRCSTTWTPDDLEHVLQAHRAARVYVCSLTGPLARAENSIKAIKEAHVGYLDFSKYEQELEEIFGHACAEAHIKSEFDAESHIKSEFVDAAIFLGQLIEEAPAAFTQDVGSASSAAFLPEPTHGIVATKNPIRWCGIQQ